jgi:hypothetical protein
LGGEMEHLNFNSQLYQFSCHSYCGLNFPPNSCVETYHQCYIIKRDPARCRAGALVVAATWEAEVGRLLEPKSLRLAWAKE